MHMPEDIFSRDVARINLNTVSLIYSSSYLLKFTVWSKDFIFSVQVTQNCMTKRSTSYSKIYDTFIPSFLTGNPSIAKIGQRRTTARNFPVCPEKKNILKLEAPKYFLAQNLSKHA